MPTVNTIPDDLKKQGIEKWRLNAKHKPDVSQQLGSDNHNKRSSQASNDSDDSTIAASRFPNLDLKAFHAECEIVQNVG